MELKLKRPIVFLDLETTGVDPAKDRIVEISLVKVQPDGSKEVKTRRINPGMPIPVLAEEFLRAGVDVDLKKRRFIDVQNIFHKMEQRTLVAAYRFYCDRELEGAHSAEADTLATYEVLKAQLDRYPELENDVEFLAKFTEQNRCADYAGRILYDKDGVEVFGFGKYRGRPVAEVFREEPGYYSWMMNGDFPMYTKKVITEIRLRDAALNKK